MDWLDDVESWVSAIADASLDGSAHDLIVGPPLPGEWGGPGMMASYLAGTHAIFARRGTAEAPAGASAPRHFDAARHFDAMREYLLLPAPVHAFAAEAFWTAVGALRAAGKLSPAEEQQIHLAATKEAHGARRMIDHHFGLRRYNHAVTTANLYDVIARLWPDSSDAASSSATAEDVWREWWVLGDNLEVAANYEAFAQFDLLCWADRRGERNRALADPMTHYWIDRGLDHFLPLGIMPGYGDTCTMELWPDWFAFFALVAAWTDGERARRARWAAEHMFAWAKQRDWIRNVAIIDEVPEDPYRAKQAWGQLPRTAWFLAAGIDLLRAAPADLEPEAPPARPVVTHRVLPTHTLMRSGSWSLAPPAPGPRVADKVVLRLGRTPASPAAMISCSRQIWHDHLDAGAVLAWAADGALLLDGSGYMQRYPIFHNLFWVARADGAWLSYTIDDYNRHAEMARPSDFQLVGLTGGAVAQMATVEAAMPHLLPIFQERAVLLTRTGVMIVHDRVEPVVDGLVGSPLWHAQRVRRAGDGWAEVSVDEFHGMNGPWFKNADASALVINPLDAARWSETVQDNPEPYASPHYAEPVTRYFTYWKASHVSRICLSQPRPLVVGKPNHFVTVLVPADRIDSAEKAVRPVGGSAGRSFVMEVAGCTYVTDAGETPVSGPWGATDARVLWADGDGVFAHRVRRVELPGVAIESPRQWVDLDLAWDDRGVEGTISAERETNVRIAVAGHERTAVVRGVTPVHVAF